MKLSQKFLNSAFVVAILCVILYAVTKIFNLDPWSFFGNLLVYILLLVGVGLLTPAAIGFGWGYFIQLVDNQFGKPGENLPDGVHFWTAIISSVFVGLFWAKTVVPIISRAYALSVWPVEMFRFETVYEGYTSWGWVVFSGLFFAIGYAVYFLNRQSSQN